MKAFSRSLLLKLFSFWNALRACFMTVFVFRDFRSLVEMGNGGPYVGIGINRRLLLVVAAMPCKLVGILLGFRYGKIGDVATEVVAVVAYAFLSISILRSQASFIKFGVVFNAFEVLLLGVLIFYAMRTSLLLDFRVFALSFWSVAFLTYAFTTICVWLDAAKRSD